MRPRITGAKYRRPKSSHVVPFADGGATNADNLQLRCRAHHAYKVAHKHEPQKFIAPTRIYPFERVVRVTKHWATTRYQQSEKDLVGRQELQPITSSPSSGVDTTRTENGPLTRGRSDTIATMYTAQTLLDVHARAHESLRRLIVLCGALTDDELRRPVAGFGWSTIYQQLEHTIGAEVYWQTVVTRGYADEAILPELPDVAGLGGRVRRRVPGRRRLTGADAGRDDPPCQDNPRCAVGGRRGESGTDRTTGIR